MNATEQSKKAIIWIEELEHGDRKQGRRQLGDAETGFCCLGVGCDLFGIARHPEDPDSLEFGMTVGLALAIGQFKEGKTFFGKASLANVNDLTNIGFKGIAKILREHPEEVFIREVAQKIKEHYS